MPGGAVPKDGPSAGISIACAIASALGRLVPKPGIAMTGELSLSGQVLAVGGVREKLLAAHRHGIKHLIIPQANERDLDQLDKDIRRGLQIDLVEELDDVLQLVLPKLPRI